MTEAPVFSFTKGRAIHPGTISQTFHALVPRLALVLPAGVAPPHVHDLRHNSEARIIPSAALVSGGILRFSRGSLA